MCHMSEDTKQILLEFNAVIRLYLTAGDVTAIAVRCDVRESHGRNTAVLLCTL